MNGNFAYASQEPWIFNATLKENILFGKDFDESKYKSVIKSCCLEQDLEILPSGDRTEVTTFKAFMWHYQKRKKKTDDFRKL